MKIERMFLIKNFDADKRYAIESCSKEPEILKETEKAYFLEFKTEYGIIKSWFPKAVCHEDIIEVEEVETEELAEGDTVEHSTFGKGIVKNVNGDMVTVKFEKEKKDKVLIQRIAKLKKI